MLTHTWGGLSCSATCSLTAGVLARAGRRAQLYAPRLMAVMAEDPAARKHFRQGWQAVPPDAFLAWAPSMLSLLDEDVGDALLPLLQVGLTARQWPETAVEICQTWRFDMDDVRHDTRKRR